MPSFFIDKDDLPGGFVIGDTVRFPEIEELEPMRLGDVDPPAVKYREYIIIYVGTNFYELRRLK